MYLTDLKKDFFDKVVTSRVLLLVNSDVDGVCATKILQYLFKVSDKKSNPSNVAFLSVTMYYTHWSLLLEKRIC